VHSVGFNKYIYHIARTHNEIQLYISDNTVPFLGQYVTYCCLFVHLNWRSNWHYDPQHLKRFEILRKIIFIVSHIIKLDLPASTSHVQKFSLVIGSVFTAGLQFISCNRLLVSYSALCIILSNMTGRHSWDVLFSPEVSCWLGKLDYT